MYQIIKDRFSAFIDSITLSKEEKDVMDILKLEHTMRVVELSETLAASVFADGDTDSINLAKIIAVLHDVGRWEQMRISSLNDTHNDHGEMRAEIIIRNSMLSGIDKCNQNIILTAIREHNKKYAGVFGSPTQTFVNIVRDADKLDNLFIEVKDYASKSHEKSMQKVLPFSDEHRLSRQIFDCVMGNCLADSDMRETKIDFKFFKMAWCYDIKIAKSMDIIREKRYIHDIFNDIHNPDKIMIQAYQKVCEYVKHNKTPGN